MKTTRNEPQYITAAFPGSLTGGRFIFTDFIDLSFSFTSASIFSSSMKTVGSVIWRFDGLLQAWFDILYKDSKINTIILKNLMMNLNPWSFIHQV